MTVDNYIESFPESVQILLDQFSFRLINQFRLNLSGEL